ncbi:MAG: signal peptide peptidase SppA [Bdellovibrionales bacterium]
MNYKNFLLRFFAAVGLILPFVLGVGAWTLWHQGLIEYHPPKELPDEIILSLDLTVPLEEQAGSFRLSLPSLIEDSEGQAFFPLVLAIQEAAKDKRVRAIVAELGPYGPSLVHAQELAAVLEGFRKTKKPSYIFAPTYGAFGPGGNATYYLASQFEHIWLQPVGSVGLTGIGVEAPFFKSAFEEWGIETDFLRRKDYKSVMENISRDSFSPTVKQNMQAMLASLSSQLSSGIALARGVDPSNAAKWMAEGPYTAAESLTAKLVTHIGYKDEIEDELKKKFGKDAEMVDAATYLYMKNDERDDDPKAKVALIHAQGAIVDASPSHMTDEQVIDAPSIIEAFHTAVEDKDIKAVLFRVNSPGGSPIASESMRRAIMLAKKAGKPVFVSMGEVAASGGYWIAMDGSRIIADPATITGSIGVVAGKPVFGKLMEKLGIKWDSFETSENATMWSSRHKFTKEQRSRMNAMLDDTYQTFIKNVSEARKIPLEKMEDVAGGRVFTGEDALKVGLVDELGGLNSAVKALKKELKLKETDKIALIPLPEPETPRSMMMQFIKEFFSSYTLLRNFYGTAVKWRNYFSGGIKAQLPVWAIGR